MARVKTVWKKEELFINIIQYLVTGTQYLGQRKQPEVILMPGMLALKPGSPWVQPFTTVEKYI